MDSVIRLRRLELEHFRGIQQANIDLDADIVLIYGRNGVGKSTIFDGIECALFGRIRRLERIAQEQWSTWLKNVHSSEPWRLAVGLSVGPDVVRLGSAPMDRETSQHWRRLVVRSDFASENEAERVHDVVLASHLLSQNVLDEISSRSVLDVWTLGLMTGHGWLLLCRDRAVEVDTVLGKTLEARTNDLAMLQEESGVVSGKLGTWRARREALAALLEQTANSAKALGLGTADDLEQLLIVVRQERAAAERRVVELQMAAGDTEEDVTSLKNEFDRLCKRRTKLMNERESNAQALEAAAKGAEAQSVAYTAQVSRRDMLKQCLDDTIAFEAAKGDLQVLGTQLAEDQAALEDRGKQLELVNASLCDAERAETTATAVANIAADKWARVTSLLDAQREHQLAEQNLARISSQERAERLLRTAATLTSAEPTASRDTSYDTELNALAENIIASEPNEPRCPLCGTEFEDVHRLLDSIKAERTNRGAIFAAAHAQTSVTVEETAASPSAAHAHDEAARRAEDAHVRLASEREAWPFEADALKMTGDYAAVVWAELTNARRDQNLAADVLNDCRRSAESILRASQRLQSQIDEYRDREQEIRSTLLVLRSRIDNTALALAFPSSFLETDGYENLRKLIEREQALLADKAAVREQAQNSYQMLSEQNTILAADIGAVEDQRLAVEALLDRAEKREVARRLRLEQIGLSPNATPAEIRGAQEASRARLDELAALERLLINVDIHDRLTMSRLDDESDGGMRLGRAIEAARREISAAEIARSEVADWQTRIRARLVAVVRDFLSVSHISINQHFRTLIPNPQQFDRIEITESEQAVKLGLKFRGREVADGEPQYFLSTAQMRVLGLSIFLTLAENQSWSSLQTVLLDDPVENLDNLDSIALIDGLREFVRITDKQLIISTCDENLFRLMIRKFGGKWRGKQRRLIAMRLNYDTQHGVVVDYERHPHLSGVAADAL